MFRNLSIIPPINFLDFRCQSGDWHANLRMLFLQEIHRHLRMGEFNEHPFYSCFHKKNFCACYHGGHDCDDELVDAKRLIVLGKQPTASVLVQAFAERMVDN